ncbi:sigma factor [Polyangium jinanense]|uniref:sigma factor n=1 Tax=Polyangium jinanense TaxID=2829994 RepID=UPI0023418A86|nr:sigma factor [Polyangium jinanense]
METLYKAHADAILARLRRLGIEGPALEDLLQDVFVIALQRQAKIPQDNDSARRWLLDAARKLAANFHRVYRHKYEGFRPDAIEAAVAEPEDPEGAHRALLPRSDRAARARLRRP